MNTYTLEIHYRYNIDEKDFFEKEVQAKDEKEAVRKGYSLRRNVFKVEVKK